MQLLTTNEKFLTLFSNGSWVGKKWTKAEWGLMEGPGLAGAGRELASGLPGTSLGLVLVSRNGD